MRLFNFVGSSTASRADIPESARDRGDEAVAAQRSHPLRTLAVLARRCWLRRVLSQIAFCGIFVAICGDLVRKSLRNSGGSHNSENHFFIDSISTAKAGHVCFLICSGRLKT